MLVMLRWRQLAMFHIVILVFYLPSTEGSITWQPSTAQTIEAVQGSTAIFVWKVTLDAKTLVGTIVSTQKDGSGANVISKVPNADATVAPPFKSRENDLQLTVSLNTTTNTATINFTLRNVSLSADDGRKFQVIVVLSDFQTTLSGVYNQVVQVLPGVPTIAIQPNQAVLCQTQTVNLTCSVTTGKPGDTNITIYNNDDYIGSTMKNGAAVNSMIMVSYMTSLKTGSNSFECTATNQAGTSESQPRSVTAKEPPALKCDNKTAVENKVFVLGCQVTGTVPLTAAWSKVDDGSFSSTNINVNFPSVKRSDGGMYVLTVSNGDECPSDNHTVYLDVIFKPGVPTIAIQPNTTVLYQAQTMNLICSVTTGKPGDTNITFYNNDDYIGSTIKNGAAVNSMIMASYITSLKTGSNSFKCTATNQVGTSESQPQNVKGLYTVLLRLPNIIQVQPNQNSLSVTWDNVHSPHNASCLISVTNVDESNKMTRSSTNNSQAKSISCTVNGLTSGTLFVVYLMSKNIEGQRNGTMYLTTTTQEVYPLPNKQTPISIVYVLGTLVAVLLVVILLLIVYFVRERRRHRRGLRKTTRSTDDDNAHAQNISLEDISKYEQVGRRVRASNEDTVLKYELVETKEQTPNTSQRDPMPHPDVSSQPQLSTNPVYESIQPEPRNYSSLSRPLTQLPIGASSPEQTQSGAQDSEYQALQGVSRPQYQSLNASGC